MFREIPCKQCGNILSSLDKTTVTITYSVSRKVCSCCNQIDTQNYNFQFCSENCFEAYYIHDTARAEPKLINKI
jgi:hypothetical protein